MKKIVLLFCVLLMTSEISFAASFGAYDAGAVNSQYMRDLRVHEAAVRAKNRSAIISTKTTPKTQAEVTTSDIKAIIFVNNSSIPSSELLSVVQDKINKPMTSENITAIRKDIMKYYQDRGYFSALAMVVSQDTVNGEVVIEIKEGGKNSIQIQ